MRQQSVSLPFALALAWLAACNDDKPKSHSAPSDAAVSDAAAGRDAAAADGCSRDPHSHAEIINACTDAEVVDKHPELPLLLPDGGLPPLP